jgi:hypothetical protein
MAACIVRTEHHRLVRDNRPAHTDGKHLLCRNLRPLTREADERYEVGGNKSLKVSF